MSVRVTRDVTSVTVNGTLTNLGDGTVYYKSSQGVSVASNDGSLTSGASVSLDGVQWLTSDTQAYVNVISSPVSGGTGSIKVDGATVSSVDFTGTVSAADVGALGQPPNPLDYPVVSTRPAGFANAFSSGAWLSDGVVTGSNKHRIEKMPRAVKRLGLVFMNAWHGFGSTDVIAPNPVTLRCSAGLASSGVIPGRARAFKHIALDAPATTAKTAQNWLDGDQIAFTLPAGDAVIFDTGLSFAKDDQVSVSTYAQVNSGEKFVVHSLVNAAGEYGSQSNGEPDKTLAAYGSWTQNTTSGFDYLTLVDLGDASDSPSLLVGGDSLMAGNGYGGMTGLAYGDVPYVNCARSSEQCKQFTDLDSKSFWRRNIEGKLRYKSALWQVLTNDADLVSQSFAGWQALQDEILQYLARRGITTVGWATIPPYTLSVDSYATLAGQYLDMTDASGGGKSRGFKQQLMQDWNAHLRSGGLLYQDNTIGLRLYNRPSGRPFWRGGCAIDWWYQQTVMEAVNTGVTSGGAGAGTGYDFGGQPIMKWAVGFTGDGLHDGTNPNLRAGAVRAVAKHLTGVAALV